MKKNVLAITTSAAMLLTFLGVSFPAGMMNGSSVKVFAEDSGQILQTQTITTTSTSTIPKNEEEVIFAEKRHLHRGKNTSV